MELKKVDHLPSAYKQHDRESTLVPQKLHRHFNAPPFFVLGSKKLESLQPAALRSAEMIHGLEAAVQFNFNSGRLLFSPC